MHTKGTATKTRTKLMLTEYWAIECRMISGRITYFNYLEIMGEKIIGFNPHFNTCVFYSFAERMIAESYLVRNMKIHNVESYQFRQIKF